MNEVPKQQGLPVPLLIFNNVLPQKKEIIKHTGSLSATYCPLWNSPLNFCLILGLGEKKISRIKPKHVTEIQFIYIYNNYGADIAFPLQRIALNSALFVSIFLKYK